MSLLIYKIESESVLIITDTLATDAAGEPALFTSKCFLFPHMGVAMVVTGSHDIAVRWASHLDSRLVARDIDMLDLHAPSALREVWEETWSDLASGGAAEGFTATAYHFGRGTAGHFKGFKYNSVKDFESEPLPMDGTGVKPAPDAFDWDADYTLIDLAEAARAQAEADFIAGYGPPARVGGHLVATILRDGIMTAQIMHTFEDIEDQWLAINERL
jgi:8-oxo-dGTP pyrophosphatase MutT (NUDIX family)